MKIFPLSDPILLPLAPTIARTIADYLQSIAQKSQIDSLQKNWAGDVIELPPDLDGYGQFQRSIRQIPTSQYQYVSTIAHQLAAKSSLTPLEICQNLDVSIPTLTVVERSVQLELDCWYNEASYIYFQLAPKSIEVWLNYIHDLPFEQPRGSGSSSSTGSIDPAIYAHARCCSLLKLAANEKIVKITRDWQISKSNWLPDPTSCNNRLTTDPNYIFEHPAEQQLIQTLMAVLDVIYSDNWQLEWKHPTFISGNTSLCPHPAIASGSGSPLPSLGEGLGVRAVNLRTKSGMFTLESSQTESTEQISRGGCSGHRQAPNWTKLTIDLAQSWLEFNRRCQIFGEIKARNPRLATARCALTAISRRCLHVLLENYLGVEAAVKL